MKYRTRILFVDDDRSLGETVREELEGMGYEARSESDPRKVFTEFATNSSNFDGVIVNQFMPEISGLELARWLAYTRPHIPVILISGSPDIAYLPEEEPSNIREVLFKPLNRSDLSGSLDRIFSTSGPLTGTGDRAAQSPWR